MKNEEINRRCAEALGKCWHETKYTSGRNYDCKNCGKIYDPDMGVNNNKNYAENIADAWVLVEKMIQDDMQFVLSTYRDYDGKDSGKFRAIIESSSDIFSEYSESAPMAICLAFLKVVGK